MRNITFVLLLITITIFSCSKEDGLQQTINYTDSVYYPANSTIAKNEILEFLSATSTYNGGAVAKTTFLSSNKKINKGKWLMEGASNYLSNVNLNLKTDTIVNFNMEVNNIIDNEGEILMSSQDMVNKFDSLHLDIDLTGNTIDKTAKIVSFNITNVSSSTTIIGIKVFYGIRRDLIPVASNFLNGLHPSVLFGHYETKLLTDIGVPSSQFYTNIELNGLLPYSHISDPNNPNYFPEQDPSHALFNPNLPRCGTNHLGLTDCKICYDCLWSEKESTFTLFDPIRKTWSATQADYYYDGTLNVVQNYINNGNYSSGLIDVDISFDSFVCGCPDDGAWQQVNLVLGKGSSY